MINPFKRKKTPAITKTKEVSRPRSLMDLIDFEPDRSQYMNAAEYLNERVFQRTAANFKQIDPGTGKAIAADKMVATSDAISTNQSASIFNVQSNIPDDLIAWYANQSFIGYQMCSVLMQHWLIDKACTMPAKDAIRKGYEVTCNDETKVAPEVFAHIEKAKKRFKINGHLKEYVRYGRCFGIRIAMFKVTSTDPCYYEKPFNIDGVAPYSYKGIVQLDPYWITPELDYDAAANAASMHFYEPTFWRINGGMRVHRSHLIIMTTGEVSDVLKPTYFYGGVPLTQKILERVYCAERTANEAPLLAMTKRLTVYKMDLTKAAAKEGTVTQLLTLFTKLRNNFGVKVIGKDEAIEQHDITLNDVDMLMMGQYQIVAAIAGVPSTKLLGTSPKGFGASGDYEDISYREELESIQIDHCEPVLDRHHLLLMKSEIEPMFGVTFDAVVNWEPLDSPKAKEVAETNYLNAQTAALEIQSGALSSEDERKRLISDPDSGYNGLDIDSPTPSPDEPDDNTPVKIPSEINDNIKNMTGKQHQQMQRTIRKFNKGEYNEAQATTLLKSGLGMSDDDIKSLLGTNTPNG